MYRLTPRPRAAVALAIVFAALFVCAAPQIASGDPISDKRAQADALAAKIDALNGTIERYAEQHNAAQIELDGIKAQVAEAEARVAAAQAQLASHQGELRSYAIDAYVKGGDDTEAAAVSAGSDDLALQDQRAGYLAAAAGNRQQLIDGLNSMQQDVQVQIGQLNTAKAQSEAKTKAVADSQRKAQDAANEQQALYSQAKGELAQLVAEAQAREERARQAAAAQRAQTAVARRSRNSPGLVANPGPASGNAATAVQTALNQVGDPYVWGAAGPDTFDCSGLTMYAWRAAGVGLPHNTNAQYSATRHISIDQLQPGDLVYYNGFGHMGMYIGNGQIVHAPHSGDVVKVTGLYYPGNPVGASRP